MPWTEFVRFTQDYSTSGISNVSNLLGSNTGTVTFSDAGDQTYLTTPNLSGLIPEHPRITGMQIKANISISTAITSGPPASLIAIPYKWNGSFYSTMNVGTGTGITGFGTSYTNPQTAFVPAIFSTAETNLINYQNSQGKLTRDDLDDIAILLYYTDNPDNDFIIHGDTTTPSPSIRIYYELPTVRVNTGKVVLGSGKTQIG